MPVNPFGLNESPYAAGHDRRFLCPTRKRDEGITLLRKHVAAGAPFLMVTGDPGIGKTSIVWEALGAPGLKAKVAFVTHSSLGPAGLLEAVCLQFGIAVSDPSARSEMKARLEQHLCLLRSRGCAAVLVLDDAHGASPDQLEELLGLSEMKAEGRELLQIVLVGLPELQRRLARPELERLQERVAAHHRILPFSPDETERYLHHRLTLAGGQGPIVFPSETCREIHNYSYGFPRDINTLANRALDRAARENARTVRPDHVRAAVAAARLRGETTAPRPAADVPAFPPATAELETIEPRPPISVSAADTAPIPAPLAAAAPEVSLPAAQPAATPLAAPTPTTAPPAAAPPAAKPADIGTPVAALEAAPSLRVALPMSPRPAATVPPAAPVPPRPPQVSPAAPATIGSAGPRSKPVTPTPIAPLRWGHGIEPTAASAESRNARRPMPESKEMFATPGRPLSETLLQVGLAAVVVAGLMVTVLLVMRSWEPSEKEEPRPVITAPDGGGTARVAPAVDPTSAVPAPEREVARSTPAPRATTPPLEPAPVPANPSSENAAAPNSPRAAFGLEVASYIDRERAAEEAGRIADATGQPCRVVHDPETDSHTVVLGAFATQYAAERAANGLLGRDLVRQARVVPLAGGDPTP